MLLRTSVRISTCCKALVYRKLFVSRNNKKNGFSLKPLDIHFTDMQVGKPLRYIFKTVEIYTTSKYFSDTVLCRMLYLVDTQKSIFFEVLSIKQLFDETSSAY